ncbi:MAG: phosphoesterase [Acidobacteria bacterium]|nr:MAG: phosphoesterase [Acidobacteriota bacterium]PYR16964.1 MAG: phosphoesterase [Acidobacteriota bacterium]
MRVAALYDIHGNLPALEAVLQDIRQAAVDAIVVGGDVVVGPMSRETVSCLLDVGFPVHFIHGNAEVAVLDQMAGRNPAAVPEQYWPILRWTAQELTEYEPLLASWPKTRRLDIAGLGDVLFCHGTPRDDNEVFTRLTPEERLLPVFEGLNVVVCGHTHMQFDRMIGTTRVVNAGSVGAPFGEPGADWLLLGPEVGFRHTSYDFANAAERMRATNYPEDFAARYVLATPSAAEMLEMFTAASLR